MNRITALVVFCCFMFSAHAQSLESKQNIKANLVAFQSVNLIGLIEGGNGSAFQLQSINGVKINTWFAGVGVGIDYYRYRTIPFFLDLRKDLQKKARTAFLFGDIGSSLPWVKKDENIYWMETNDYKNGLFYELGFGYKVIVHHRDAFLISAGYSFKQLTEKRFGITSCPLTGPCQEGLIDTYSYDLKRLSLKLGWSF